MSRLVPLVIAAALGGAPLVLAQQPGAGFFPPQPDPALNRTLPPEDYPDTRPAAPAQAAPFTPAQTSAQPTPTTTVPPGGAAVSANVEEQMDRSEYEARRAQEAAARAPQPINGAFTGSTDERDR